MKFILYLTQSVFASLFLFFYNKKGNMLLLGLFSNITKKPKYL